MIHVTPFGTVANTMRECLLLSDFRGTSRSKRHRFKKLPSLQDLKYLCVYGAYLYAEYIMRNTGLDEAQAGIKVSGRSINNLRYADDTTLMAESKEELKGLLMNVKEESEKVGLKAQHSEN